MAPEMFGRDPDPLAADVYALGQVFCELLMGPPSVRSTNYSRISSSDASCREAETVECDPGEHVDEDLRSIIRLATAADPQTSVCSNCVRC